MSLEKDIMQQMKTAMKAKDAVALEALRAIKSSLLLLKTEKANAEITEVDELKLLQKLVKQRRDSAALFTDQNRADLATPELAQAAIIEQFLPAQLNETEITAVVKSLIERTNASTMKDMGKIMGLANKELAGKADGATISKIVKSLL